MTDGSKSKESNWMFYSNFSISEEKEEEEEEREGNKTETFFFVVSKA